MTACSACDRPAELEFTDPQGWTVGFCLACAGRDSVFSERLAQTCVAGFFAQGMLLARCAGEESYKAHWARQAGDR